jgi:hypothetical protein
VGCESTLLCCLEFPDATPSKLIFLSCSLFGVKVVSPQPLLKALPKLFEAKQEPVRDGAKNLVVSICPISVHVLDLELLCSR